MSREWNSTIEEFEKIVRTVYSDQTVVLGVIPLVCCDKWDIRSVKQDQHVDEAKITLERDFSRLNQEFGNSCVFLTLDLKKQSSSESERWLKLLYISTEMSDEYPLVFIVDRGRIVVPNPKNWLVQSNEIDNSCLDFDELHYFPPPYAHKVPILEWALLHVQACRKTNLNSQRRRTNSLEVVQELKLELEQLARKSFAKTRVLGSEYFHVKPDIQSEEVFGSLDKNVSIQTIKICDQVFRDFVAVDSASEDFTSFKGNFTQFFQNEMQDAVQGMKNVQSRNRFELALKALLPRSARTMATTQFHDGIKSINRKWQTNPGQLLLEWKPDDTKCDDEKSEPEVSESVRSNCLWGALKESMDIVDSLLPKPNPDSNYHFNKITNHLRAEKLDSIKMDELVASLPVKHVDIGEWKPCSISELFRVMQISAITGDTVLLALHRRQHLKKGRDDQTRMLQSMNHFVHRHSDLRHVWMKTFEISTATDEGACEVEIVNSYQNSQSVQIRLQDLIGDVRIPVTQSMVIVVVAKGELVWRPSHSCDKPVECEQSSSGTCSEPVKNCKFWKELSSILTAAGDANPKNADQRDINRLETLPLDGRCLNMLQLMTNIEDLSDFGVSTEYWPEKAIRTGKQYFEVRLLNDTSVFVGFELLGDQDDADMRDQSTSTAESRAIGRNPNSWSFNVRSGHARAWDCNTLTEWSQASFMFPGTIGIAVDADVAEIWFYWQGRRICRSSCSSALKSRRAGSIGMNSAGSDPYASLAVLGVSAASSAALGSAYEVNWGTLAPFDFAPPTEPAQSLLAAAAVATASR